MAIVNSLNLATRQCVPVVPGTKPLNSTEVQYFLKYVKSGWVYTGKVLTKTFVKEDFKAALAFLNKISEISEQNLHHPDFILKYNILEVSLFTHSIGGLSENDFIIAAKIDQIV